MERLELACVSAKSFDFSNQLSLQCDVPFAFRDDPSPVFPETLEIANPIDRLNHAPNSLRRFGPPSGSGPSSNVRSALLQFKAARVASAARTAPRNFYWPGVLLWPSTSR